MEARQAGYSLRQEDSRASHERSLDPVHLQTQIQGGHRLQPSLARRAASLHLLVIHLASLPLRYEATRLCSQSGWTLEKHTYL